MRFKILFILFLIAVSCCKEDNNSPNSLIGRWYFANIDSCILRVDSQFRVKNTFPDSGWLEFFEDSTGRFERPPRFITGGLIDFRWVHHPKRNQIDFNFSNGSTSGILNLPISDTTGFFLRDYLGPIQSIKPKYYYFKIFKTQ
jgi:hypothetical protein